MSASLKTSLIAFLSLEPQLIGSCLKDILEPGSHTCDREDVIRYRQNTPLGITVGIAISGIHGFLVNTEHPQNFIARHEHLSMHFI